MDRILKWGEKPVNVAKIHFNWNPRNARMLTGRKQGFCGADNGFGNCGNSSNGEKLS